MEKRNPRQKFLGGKHKGQKNIIQAKPLLTQENRQELLAKLRKTAGGKP